MMEWIASAAFGLEGLVKRELQALGFDVTMDQGGVRFFGGTDAAFCANLELRTADRVQLIVGEGEARSFEELFQLISAIAWEDYIPRGGSFPVTGQCGRSQLMSVRDVQAISKKAVAERLKQRYKMNWLDESKESYDIHVAIHQDKVRVTLDASGDALNRRGYRTWNGEAPLRETLAAALVIFPPGGPEGPCMTPAAARAPFWWRRPSRWQSAPPAWCGPSPWRTGTLRIKSSVTKSGARPGSASTRT